VLRYFLDAFFLDVAEHLSVFGREKGEPSTGELLEPAVLYGAQFHVIAVDHDPIEIRKVSRVFHPGHFRHGLLEQGQFFCGHHVQSAVIGRFPGCFRLRPYSEQGKRREKGGTYHDRRDQKQIHP